MLLLLNVLRRYVLFIGFSVLAGCGSSDGEPNVLTTLTADAERIVAGQSATLTWSSINATSCSASGAWTGTKAASGSEAVQPSGEGMVEFRLSCKGEGEANAASVTLEVLSLLEILPPTTAPLAVFEDEVLPFDLPEFATNREPISPISFSVLVAPNSGSLLLDDQQSTYTPDLNFFGEDVFTIQATSEGVTASVEIIVDVTPVNDAPEAVLKVDGLALDSGLTFLIADPEFKAEMLVTDIDSQASDFTYSALLDGEEVNLTVVGNHITFRPPNKFKAGRTALEVIVSDGENETSAAVDFWGSEILGVSPSRARVTQIFGDIRSNDRRIDHYIVLNGLTSEPIKTAIWEAMAFFYDDFFVQGDDRRRALVDSLFNVVVIDFPEGLEEPLTIETGCIPGAEATYCMSDIVPQAIDFLDELALFNELTDVRVAADIFSIFTSVLGEGTALGRYNIQPITSAENTVDSLGPNHLLWVLKHELGHSFGWLGDHNSGDVTAVDNSGVLINDFTDQLPTVDFFFSDITLEDEVDKVKWHHKYGDSTSIPGWNNVDDKTNAAVGYWQGCYFDATNCFRATYNSIMAGEFPTGAARQGWMLERESSDAVEYDEVGTEAQFLRSIHLQGANDLSVYLPQSETADLVVEHNLALPAELFAIDWFVDGTLVENWGDLGATYEHGPATDSYVGRITIPRKASGELSRLAYRVRDLGLDPAVSAVDELTEFADVYLGRFSYEGGFYLCPEPNTEWDEAGDTYCHVTANVFLDDGSMVFDVSSESEVFDRYNNVRYYIERSGLGAQVVIDWKYF
jgi:hypothetical protein